MKTMKTGTFTGSHHTEFEITINLTGITLATSVSDWTTGDPITGNAIM